MTQRLLRGVLVLNGVGVGIDTAGAGHVAIVCWGIVPCAGVGIGAKHQGGAVLAHARVGDSDPEPHPKPVPNATYRGSNDTYNLPVACR